MRFTYGVIENERLTDHGLDLKSRVFSGRTTRPFFEFVTGTGVTSHVKLDAMEMRHSFLTGSDPLYRPIPIDEREPGDEK